jgi:fatty acid desaturase
MAAAEALICRVFERIRASAGAGTLVAMAGDMRTQLPQLATHLLRIALSLVAHVVALHAGHLLAAYAGAAAMFFAAFALAHDLTHGTLGLSPRGRKWALGAVAQLFLVSGQVMRTLHLRHHARPGAADDLEGAALGLGCAGTFIRLPVLFFSMRFFPFHRNAKQANRGWMFTETLLNALTLATAVLVAPLRPYVVTMLALQFLTPLWGGYLPHRAPDWLRAFARSFDFAHSPTVMSLAYHDLHHERADIPCQELGTFAQAAGW